MASDGGGLPPGEGGKTPQGGRGDGDNPSGAARTKQSGGGDGRAALVCPVISCGGGSTAPSGRGRGGPTAPGGRSLDGPADDGVGIGDSPPAWRGATSAIFVSAADGTCASFAPMTEELYAAAAAALSSDAVAPSAEEITAAAAAQPSDDAPLTDEGHAAAASSAIFVSPMDGSFASFAPLTGPLP